MIVKLWGTRGSLANAGPETIRYGGNTSCVEVRGRDGTLLVLDAGTGIRRLGASLAPDVTRVDLLLTHLHMDHIQGLGFFDPLYRDEMEVHIWGPPSTMLDMPARLVRYLSPPLFPVRLARAAVQADVARRVAPGRLAIGEFEIAVDLVCHPGPTAGYRISENGCSLAYLPDHEPALGSHAFPSDPEWMSGYDIAAGTDMLLHDSQYTAQEYPEHLGWGHSSIDHALDFARATGVQRLVTFHHDPAHDDAALDALIEGARNGGALPFELIAGTEGSVFELA